MEDSMTALHRLHQNQKLSHPHHPFDDKALIIQLVDRGFRYREQGMPTAMIQAGVVTEVREVRTAQRSMVVDQEADRLKVSRRLPVRHQPKE